MTRKALITLTVAVCGLFSPYVGRSQAALITIEITGEVTDVTDAHDILEGKINPGDTVTGRYTYDTSMPDSNPAGWGGTYWYYDPPCGIWLTIDGLEFKSNPDDMDFGLGIGDNVPPLLGGSGGDAYGVGSLGGNLLLKNGAIVSDIFVSDISLSLWDGSCKAISSDVLPETAPVLDDWEASSIRIRGGYPRPRGGSFFEIEGYLTSAVLIPEPGTLVLLGICTVGLLRMRRCPESDRKERNRR